MHKFIASILILTMWPVLIGCRNTLPCPDCNDEAAEADETPPPDLPCDGADLMTDNLNCGSCGHECVVDAASTPIEAGFCVDGTCGPLWTICTAQDDSLPTCTEVCGLYGQTCVENGCAGHTGVLFDVDLLGHGCAPHLYTPSAEITGGCDAPIPWLSTDEWSREVMCCCDFQ